MVIFKSKQNKLEGDLKIKSCGKRLYHTESVKYIQTLLGSIISMIFPLNWTELMLSFLFSELGNMLVLKY